MPHTPADRLSALQSRPARLVAGIMTGTSLDAIDVAFVRIEGAGEGAALRLVSWQSTPFGQELQAMLRRNMAPETSSVDDVCLLHAALGRACAEAVRNGAREAGLDLAAVDLIGCHGQTVRHLPEPRTLGADRIRSTLQIGSAAMLATLTGIPVISDFRSADMALEGQGAPLVPYADYLLFRSASTARIALNIGGIANITVLPAGCVQDAVVAYDTGPGNMVLDALAQELYGEPFDRDGAHAARGRVDEELLIALLSHEYFARPYPKTTGREMFGAAYVRNLLAANARRDQLPPEDLLASCSELTTRTIAAEIRRHTGMEPADVIVSGGGAQNNLLMGGLRRLLPGLRVALSDEWGIPTGAKESVAFALFANEWLFGHRINIPSATGARRPALCGNLSLP